MSESTTIAVDVAKSVFEIAVSHQAGKVAERRRVGRDRFLRFFAQRPPATILLEASSSAHHWARKLREHDHHPILLPPKDVRPYRRGNKTDRADAKALLEAFRNDELRPVPVKTVHQQALTSLHRLRSAWLATRVARLNTLRSLLRELGHTIPRGARHVVPRALALIEDAEAELSEALRLALAEACLEIRQLEERLATVEQDLHRLARQIPAAAHLRTIPGVGLITSTALVAFVGDIRRFPTGRHFAAYLGLTPREHSSGLRRRLGRITKRGDAYLRMLLVHGARSVLWASKRKPQPARLQDWARSLEARRGHNIAAVALANRLARIVWSVWKQGRDFAPQAACPS